MVAAQIHDADDRPEPRQHVGYRNDNGALLGLTHYLFHRSTIAIGPVCCLQDLFTPEASRRIGVGRALIEEVYREAKLLGCGRVYWHTQETNRPAIALYDKVAEHFGFIRHHKQFGI